MERWWLSLTESITFAAIQLVSTAVNPDGLLGQTLTLHVLSIPTGRAWQASSAFISSYNQTCSPTNLNLRLVWKGDALPRW